MLGFLWTKYEVRHRIDGLEKELLSKDIDPKVRHRIDGLENCDKRSDTALIVRHRIDGLENSQRSAIDD